MKCSISNIAWDKENDDLIYDILSKNNFTGLEIAPTRVFENPYEQDLSKLQNFKNILKEKGLVLTSMQSLIFNRPDLTIFEKDTKREELKEYLKKAIDFAYNLDIKNLVFGSPKNRIYTDIDKDYIIAIDFFKELGDYAYFKDTCLSIEANPKIYGTNFINTTQEAYNLVKDVNSKGFKLHLDTGTILINNESLNEICNYSEHINHVHISEPYLDSLNEKNIKFYEEFINILKEINYNKFISIEMKKNELDKVIESIQFISNIVFGG